MPLSAAPDEEERHEVGDGWVGDRDKEDLDNATLDEPPVHPIACMQGAFEESMVESAEDPDANTFSERPDSADAMARRRLLLEAEDYQQIRVHRWKRMPDAKYHSLWKLLAQIAFGLHLLQQQLAKSNEEVVKILQTHVDEVDNFLERTAEDLDLAMDDMADRFRYLRLPLEHLEVFDTMLDDATFRASIVDGNDKILRIAERTELAMRDSLRDLRKGLEATIELAGYLERLGFDWTEGDQDMATIYKQMKGNAEGWFRCFRALRVKGDRLERILSQLRRVVREVSKRADIASRRTKLAVRPPQNGPWETPSRIASRPPTSKFSPPISPNKPLPRCPEVIASKRGGSLPQLQCAHYTESRDSDDGSSSRKKHTKQVRLTPESGEAPALQHLRINYLNNSKLGPANEDPNLSTQKIKQPGADYLDGASDTSAELNSPPSINPDTHNGSPASTFVDSAYSSGTDNLTVLAAGREQISDTTSFIHLPSQGLLTPSAASTRSSPDTTMALVGAPPMPPVWPSRKASGPGKVTTTITKIFHKRTASMSA